MFEERKATNVTALSTRTGLNDEEEEVSASSKPFLVIHDADSEAIYCIQMRTKEAKRWVIVIVNAILRDLGYDGVKIPITCDGAR